MAIFGIAEGADNFPTATPLPTVNDGIDDAAVTRVQRVGAGGEIRVDTKDLTIAMLNEQRIQTLILATLAGGGIFSDDLDTLRNDFEQQQNYDLLAPSTGP